MFRLGIHVSEAAMEAARQMMRERTQERCFKYALTTYCVTRTFDEAHGMFLKELEVDGEHFHLYLPKMNGANKKNEACRT